jgi:hypothetical protein
VSYSQPETPGTVVIIPPSNALIRILSVLALLSACKLMHQEVPEDVTEDGLVRTDIKGVDNAYVRPGSTLAPYRRIRLDPVQIAFSEDWDPERTGSRVKLSDAEREKIRTDLGTLFMSVFKQEVEKGGYAVVDTSAPDVLRVTPSLVDVYINAPDVMTPGRTRTYVMNAGRMTLVAELRDSESGAILARVSDQREAREETTLQLSNAVENSAQARRMISDWARILRARLDTVRMQSEPVKPAK